MRVRREGKGDRERRGGELMIGGRRVRVRGERTRSIQEERTKILQRDLADTRYYVSRTHCCRKGAHEFD